MHKSITRKLYKSKPTQSKVIGARAFSVQVSTQCHLSTTQMAHAQRMDIYSTSRCTVEVERTEDNIIESIKGRYDPQYIYWGKVIVNN